MEVGGVDEEACGVKEPAHKKMQNAVVATEEERAGSAWNYTERRWKTPCEGAAMEQSCRVLVSLEE